VTVGQTPHITLKTGIAPGLTQFAVETAAESMFTISSDGLILDVNQIACERLEYPWDELVGLHVADIDPHYPRERWPVHFDEMRDLGRMTFETQHRSKSGRILDVEVSVANFRFDGVEYACSWVRDITRRMEAEKLLRLQREVLARIATTAGDQTETLNMLCRLVEGLVPESLVTVMLLNRQDQLLRFAAGPGLTPEVCQAFEPLRPSENAGSCGAAAYLKRAVIVPDTHASPHWQDLLGIVDRFNLLACWSIPIFDEQDEVLGTFAISHSRQASPTEFQQQLLEMASNLASIAIGRQRSEQQLQLAHNELAHFNRQSTMGEMASGLAHELNQPLMAMVNEAYVLEMLCGQTPSQLDVMRERAGAIRAQAMRAGEIVRSMRTLAKKQMPSRVRVDIETIIDRALKIMEPELRANGIRLSRTHSRECTHANADPVQIQQVLINLIRNAVDAMREIELLQRGLAVTIDCHGTDELEIRVTDSGPGIPSADPREVFDAFHTTKADGMGLGLTICQSIAEAHRGRLEVQQVQPHGAAFSLFLPVDRGEIGEKL
jgi:PAS domain S-box-containing protein